MLVACSLYAFSSSSFVTLDDRSRGQRRTVAVPGLCGRRSHGRWTCALTIGRWGLPVLLLLWPLASPLLLLLWLRAFVGSSLLFCGCVYPVCAILECAIKHFIVLRPSLTLCWVVLVCFGCVDPWAAVRLCMRSTIRGCSWPRCARRVRSWVGFCAVPAASCPSGGG